MMYRSILTEVIDSEALMDKSLLNLQNMNVIEATSIPNCSATYIAKVASYRVI